MNVLFDLDGTLGNTLPLCISAFRNAIEPLLQRALTDAEIIAQFGPSEEGTIQALIPEHYAEGVERYMECYKRLHGQWPTPFEGVEEILSALRAAGRYVGLVTGKGPRSTKITLETYGFARYFDCVKTGSIRGPVKRERIDEILRASALAPDRFIYVGDAPSDVTAARACGLRTVAAAWAPTADRAALEAMHPDFLFHSIGAFREFVDRSLVGEQSISAR